MYEEALDNLREENTLLKKKIEILEKIITQAIKKLKEIEKCCPGG